MSHPSENANDAQSVADQVAEIQAQQKRSKTLAVLGLILAFAVLGGTILLVSANAEFFFKPNPDVDEAKRLAAQFTNDPACNALVDHVDAQAATWEKERGRIRKAIDSEDDKELAHIIGALEKQANTLATEQRRLEISVTKAADPRGDVRSQMSRYFRYTLRYNKTMQDALKARREALANPKPAPEGADAGESAPEASDAGTAVVKAPGLGVVKVDKPGDKTKPADPKAEYERAWKSMAKDQDSWRLFRQGPSPCGQRNGEVPALPEKRGELGEQWEPGDKNPLSIIKSPSKEDKSPSPLSPDSGPAAEAPTDGASPAKNDAGAPPDAPSTP